MAVLSLTDGKILLSYMSMIWFVLGLRFWDKADLTGAVIYWAVGALFLLVAFGLKGIFGKKK